MTGDSEESAPLCLRTPPPPGPRALGLSPEEDGRRHCPPVTLEGPYSCSQGLMPPPAPQPHHLPSSACVFCSPRHLVLSLCIGHTAPFLDKSSTHPSCLPHFSFSRKLLLWNASPTFLSPGPSASPLFPSVSLHPATCVYTLECVRDRLVLFPRKTERQAGPCLSD